jgi:catechol 2,3-dioxygenase-like lactoylglutathione lyase family enzyme
MKRFHVHVGVSQLDRSIAFYSKLFGAEPAVVKPDYAKWMLEDPRINFAISERTEARKGVEHVGLQVEDRTELAEVYERLQAADRPVLEEGATTCCYAKSEKSWIADPDGVMWEAFLTEGESTTYGGNPDLAQLVSANAASDACCTPETSQGECCPPKEELAADAPCCGSAG